MNARQGCYNSLKKWLTRLDNYKWIPLWSVIHSQLHSFLALGRFLSASTNEMIRDAIHHQNILGLRQFLCGYISDRWSLALKHFADLKGLISMHTWSRTLIKMALELHLDIWRVRNTEVLGLTKWEIQHRQCEQIRKEVREVYRENPELNKQFNSIHAVLLEFRLQRSPKHLTLCLHKIRH
jgi:hypothetical protein